MIIYVIPAPSAVFGVEEEHKVDTSTFYVRGEMLHGEGFPSTVTVVKIVSPDDSLLYEVSTRVAGKKENPRNASMIKFNIRELLGRAVSAKFLPVFVPMPDLPLRVDPGQTAVGIVDVQWSTAGE